jgi:hypothetical protein
MFYGRSVGLDFWSGSSTSGSIWLKTKREIRKCNSNYL